MTHPPHVILRRAAAALSVPALLLAPALATHAARPATAPADVRGPRSTVSLPAFTGTFDKHKVLYILLDTSNKAEALRDHIDYSPSLASALPTTNALYLIMNGAFVNRGPIFAYQPG